MNQYITTKNIVIAVLVIGIIILLFTTFKCNRSDNTQDLIKQIIAAKDSVIASHKENIATQERLIEEKDRTVEILQSRDSVLNVHYSESEITYKKINEKLSNISGRLSVASASNDSLRLILSKEF